MRTTPADSSGRSDFPGVRLPLARSMRFDDVGHRASVRDEEGPSVCRGTDRVARKGNLTRQRPRLSARQRNPCQRAVAGIPSDDRVRRQRSGNGDRAFRGDRLGRPAGNVEEERPGLPLWLLRYDDHLLVVDEPGDGDLLETLRREPSRLPGTGRDQG